MRQTTIIILALCAASLFGTTIASADVEAVPVGIKFTYEASGAGSVYLAGSFNGWDSQKNPMVDDGNGLWSIVMALKPGTHEYKFVVDGSWFADAGNPDTQADSFGGANSIVQIDAKGKMIAVEKKTTESGPNTAMNARITLKGRYLGQYTSRKDFNGDPRYRLQRPSHSADLNFHTKVSDIVDSYTRLRIDNTIDAELNNVQAQMNEAALDLHPGPFEVTGYWDMEMLQLGDPLESGGDVDLAGTILDDHLRSGKGTGGITFSARPFGLDLDGFLADSHDFDPEGSDDIFDNLGRDFFGLRFSRPISGITFGLNAYAVRDLYEFQDQNLLDGRPTSLEAHVTNTGDTSDHWRYQRSNVRKGLDATLPFADDRGRLQAQWMHGTYDENFFAGNKTGTDQTYGVVRAGLNTRSHRYYHTSLDYDLRSDLHLNSECTLVDESGAQAGEETLIYVFLPMDTANNVVRANHGPALGNTSTTYAETSLDWTRPYGRHFLWLQFIDVDASALPGTVDPLDPSSSRINVTTAHLIGKPSDTLGRLEVESSWTDHDAIDLGWKGTTVEAIFRAKRQIGHKTFAVADVRVVDYDLDSASDDATLSGTFWSPWIGIEYAPLPTLDLTIAYGIDPLDFGIDYSGRMIGRWRFRQEYMIDHPGATDVDAEKALEDVRAFGIRAQMRF